MLTRRTFLRRLAAAPLALGAVGALAAAPARKPNVVIIFTDDQGYQDVGCFGSPLIRTPNLDRMAREGMKFTDFYVAAPVCSPSRAALMTGCYPLRVGVPNVLFPRDAHGLHPGETTLADMLKGQGYATACFGKWHLGHKPGLLPMDQGFDEYLGIPYSNDMWLDPEAALAANAALGEGWTAEKIRAMENVRTKENGNLAPLYRNDKVVEYPVDQTTLTRRYTEEAVRFIGENKARPFFLYLPHSMPHIPIHASERFKGKSPRGLYGDVIEEIDWSVGQVLEALRQNGLAEHTLVLFTSDNGPWLRFGPEGGCALPLRDGKTTTYEGGMREPCIMWWPGTIPAGTVCAELASTIDMLPTIAALTGTNLPKDRIIDGKDITPLLKGEPGARTPHEAFYYYNGAALQAVRAGDWKLREAGKNGPELYNLREDIGESVNLAERNPEVVERLRGLMRRFDTELKAHRRPAGGDEALSARMAKRQQQADKQPQTQANAAAKPGTKMKGKQL